MDDKSMSAVLTADLDNAVEALDRMSPKKVQSSVKKVVKKATTMVRKAVQEKVKKAYPGGKTYERSPHRRSGMLRGKQYGPLYKDVKMSVYKNGFGSNVSLFSPKKGDNRWCVLMWLNDGTEERYNERTTRLNRWERQQKVTSGIQSRSKLDPMHFFETSAQPAMLKAEQWASKAFGQTLIKAFDKQMMQEYESTL